MKKLASLLLVSILGGVLALGGYFYFSEEEAPVFMNTKQEIPTYTSVGFNAGSGTGVDFTKAAKKTVHAVVHVKNMAVTSGNYLRKPGIYLRGTGSGVIISPDGYIVTNYHVIKNANQLQVTLNNNKSYKAKVVGADPKTDIALIKIEAEDLNYLPFGNSDNIEIGDWVLAVGNPFNLTSTVTAGIVSAKSRNIGRGVDVTSFIQTDAAINPGNSGGALVNTRGQLIGINTAITSQTGSYIGYSFAVPSNIAKKIVQDIIEYGNVQRGILGISGGNASDLRSKIEVGTEQGVYVSYVEPGSGAHKAGIKKGDIINKVDNIRIRKFADLLGYLKSKRPDDVVRVSVLRDGEIITKEVRLTKYETFQIKVIGLEVTNASETDLRRNHVKNGVKITRGLTPQMQAEDLKGIIITEIDNQAVYNINDVEAIINSKDHHDPISVTFVTRSGDTQTFIWR